MSNGIGKNPLLDISKVYLEQIAEKKDDSYLEPDMKKRQKNNEKARKEMEKVKGQKNPHFEEKQQGWDSVNSLADAFKEMQEVEHVDEMIDPKGAARMDAAKGKKKENQDEIDKRLMLGKYSPAVRYGKTQKEGLDPVGKEDGDVNNDGKKNKTDKYLMNRRKAIGSAIKNKMSNMKKEETEAAEYIETVAKVKEAERQNDIKRWVQKESRSSNWRNDLSEVMTDDIDSKPIKEKNVKNKIKINPKLGEAVEEIGGEILEMTEVKEGDGDPCWDSHKQVGMKKKGGKMVPNCVPKNEEVEVEEGMKPLPKNKMFRKAGNLGRDGSPEAMERSKKITKTLNKANEEIEVSEDMETPKGQQIQKKQLELDRRKLRLRMQAAQKKQATAADTVVEKHECAHNMKGKDCPVHGKKDCSSMDEATEDSLRDRRMERGGVDGNNRYKSAPKNVAMGGGKKKPYDGMSALEKVKASIRAKHGQGAIMDTKKK